VGKNINDQMGPFFQTRKGLRQGDPLSPVLFNLVVDMLSILIARSKVNGQVSGVVPCNTIKFPSFEIGLK
jgi:hypothetical protein